MYLTPYRVEQWEDQHRTVQYSNYYGNLLVALLPQRSQLRIRLCCGLVAAVLRSTVCLYVLCCNFLPPQIALEPLYQKLGEISPLLNSRPKDQIKSPGDIKTRIGYICNFITTRRTRICYRNL